MKKTFWFVALPVAALVFLLVVVTGTLITYILPKSYVSESHIKLTPAATQASESSGSLFQTETTVIRSDVVLSPVVEKLDLCKKWGERYSNGEKLPAALCFSILRSRLNVKPIKNSYYIIIGSISDSPSEAANLANAVTEAYVAHCATNSNNVSVAVLKKATVELQPVGPKVAVNILLSVAIGALSGTVIGGGCGWLVCLLRKRGGNSSAPPIARS